MDGACKPDIALRLSFLIWVAIFEGMPVVDIAFSAIWRTAMSGVAAMPPIDGTALLLFVSPLVKLPILATLHCGCCDGILLFVNAFGLGVATEQRGLATSNNIPNPLTPGCNRVSQVFNILIKFCS
jgi:hypothetical protein